MRGLLFGAVVGKSPFCPCFWVRFRVGTEKSQVVWSYEVTAYARISAYDVTNERTIHVTSQAELPEACGPRGTSNFRLSGSGSPYLYAHTQYNCPVYPGTGSPGTHPGSGG